MFVTLALGLLALAWLALIGLALVGGVFVLREYHDEGWSAIAFGAFCELTGLIGLFLTLAFVTGQIDLSSHLRLGSCYRIGEHWAGKGYARDYTLVQCGSPIGTPQP